MKKIIVLSVLCFGLLFSATAFAFKLDDLLKPDEQGQVEPKKNLEQKVSKETNVSGITKDFEKKIGGELTKVTQQIEKEIKSAQDKLQKEIDDVKNKAEREIQKVKSMADRIEQEFERIKQIKAKLSFYIRMAYIGAITFGIIFVSMLLTIIVLWFKVRKLEK